MAKKKVKFEYKAGNVNEQINGIMSYSETQARDLYDHLAAIEEPAKNELELLGAVKLQLRILAESQDKFLQWVK